MSNFLLGVINELRDDKFTQDAGPSPSLDDSDRKVPTTNNDHTYQTPHRPCIHRRVHCPFSPPFARSTPIPVRRTPLHGSPRHRRMPATRRTQETISPASLKHAFNPGHFCQEGRGLRAGTLPSDIPSWPTTKAPGAPAGGGPRIDSRSRGPRCPRSRRREENITQTQPIHHT
jgi:hypothetical protein